VAVILIVVALASQTGPMTVVPKVVDFDHAKVRPKEPTCLDRGQSDEIVVCAPKGMDIWLGDVRGFAAKPPHCGIQRAAERRDDHPRHSAPKPRRYDARCGRDVQMAFLGSLRQVILISTDIQVEPSVPAEAVNRSW
jgi:hypothetical protein